MFYRLCLFALGLCLPLHAQEKSAPKEKKVNPALVPVEDVPGLPRVLLIGDSISMGYTLPVRKLLEGKANVHRIPQNGGPSKTGVANLERWLATGKWDVIHFNHGIHDLKVMPDGKLQVEPAEYEANLRTIVSKLQATGAKVIFALTTPIPENLRRGERRFGSEDSYNAIATRVMKEKRIPINDLHTEVKPRLSELQIPKDLHYKPEGSAFLAARVAEAISTVLLTKR